MHILIEAVSDVWHPQDIKYWPFRVASHVELLLKVSVFYCLYSQVIFCCVKAVKVIWLNSAQVSHLWSATWVGIALQCAAVCFFSFFFLSRPVWGEGDRAHQSSALLSCSKEWISPQIQMGWVTSWPCDLMFGYQEQKRLCQHELSLVCQEIMLKCNVFTSWYVNHTALCGNRHIHAHFRIFTEEK